jgi:hypothetical protein
MVGVVPVMERGMTEFFSEDGSTDRPKNPWEVEIAAPGREVVYANAEVAEERARSARRVNTFMVFDGLKRKAVIRPTSNECL